MGRSRTIIGEGCKTKAKKGLLKEIAPGSRADQFQTGYVNHLLFICTTTNIIVTLCASKKEAFFGGGRGEG